MKQADDTRTKELPVTRPGRRPIKDRPMTPAERKARSRAMTLGALVGHLDEAVAALQRLNGALGRIDGLPPEANEAWVDADLHLSLARSYVPRS